MEPKKKRKAEPYAVQKVRNEKYFAKCERYQLILNPDVDADIIEFLETYGSPDQGKATKLKDILRKYIAIKKALNI